MKQSYYFSHDFSARADIKIKRLIAKHGYEGYGIYWALIEELYSNANALPTDYELLAFDIKTQPKLVESIVKDFEFFVIDGDIFSSPSIDRRLKEIEERSKTAQKAANTRWKKQKQSKNNATAMQTHSDSNAIKEKKRKEIKEKESNIPTPSKIGRQHIENLAKEHGLDLDYVKVQTNLAKEYYEEKERELTPAKLDAWLSKDSQSKKNPSNPNRITPPYYKRLN